MKFQNLTILLLSVSLLACHQAEKKTVKKIEIQSEFDAKIELSAGENLNDTPIFFNVGSISSKESSQVKTIVMSERLSKKTIGVVPIGLFSFKEDSTEMDYIISVPADTSLNNFGIHNYFELSNNQYQLKNLLEDWFRNSCELGKCKDYQWKSEISALRLID